MPVNEKSARWSLNLDLGSYPNTPGSKKSELTTAVMKGVIIEAPGSPYKVVDNLDTPKPASDQLLVKSIATAMNPV
jgi:hypothetical protein